MNIRLKIFSIIGIVFLVSSLITWLATVNLVQSQYVKIESDNVAKDTSRGTDALTNKVEQLSQKSPDWSSWDDTYKFIDDKNQAYIDSNIQAEGLQNLGINFMLFYNAQQRLVFSYGIDIETGETMDVPDELTKALQPGSKLLVNTENDEHHGLLRTTTDPLIVATSPILHSDTSGPVRGTLVFAQYLAPDHIAKLGELTHLNLAYDSALAEDGSLKSEAKTISATSAKTQTQGSQTISGYQLINDIYGNPLLVTHIVEPRNIFRQTQHTLAFYMLVVLGVTFSALLVAMYTTTKIVRQNRDIETERATKKEIEKQVVSRTAEVKEEQARLNSAIDGLNVGLLMTFKDQSKISYNPALINILGLRDLASSIINAEVNVGLSPIQQKLKLIKDVDLNSMIATCQNGGKPFEIKEAVFEDRVISVFCAPVILRLDKVIGAVVLIEDITEQKTLERSKDEFFSIASHELRTPLTAIKGNTSMILQFYKDSLKDEQLKEMVSDVHESSVRLIDIVNDFLDLSRLEQGKVSFEYEAICVEDVITSVVDEIKAGSPDSNLNFIIKKQPADNPQKVWADKNRLKQIVYNLVGNAVKFTEKGSVTISTKVLDESVKVSITDTGRGMTPGSQQLLFHKFQQAGSSLITRDTTRGTGLGLYISKMLVENMGGSISLDKSEEGAGSTFSFSVPIANDQIQTTSKQSGESAPKTDAETGLTVS